MRLQAGQPGGHRLSFPNARRRTCGPRVVCANGGARGLLPSWLNAGKLMPEGWLHQLSQPNTAVPAGQESEQTPEQVQQMAQQTAPQHDSTTDVSVPIPEAQQPPAALHFQPLTLPLLQQPITNGHATASSADASSAAGAFLAPGSAVVTGTGPIKASASELLAGVPLDQMRARQRMQEQLRRQQDQAGAGSGSTTSPPGPAATIPTPGNASLRSGTSAAPPSTPTSAASDVEGTGSGSLRTELIAVTSPEAAVALAAYERALEARRLVPVRLTVRVQAADGHRVKLVGGHKSLGTWALDSAPEMRLIREDLWEATVRLPAGSVCEYKYAVVDGAGCPVALQPGNNGVLAVGLADERLEVQDDWAGDAAGVAVVVDGDRGAWPATRGTRLVAWANDLFQQVSTLRQDLRKSRMELVGAQEEARGAQLEAARLRGELRQLRAAVAALEAERGAGRAELARAEALNGVLQAQLEETTASLKDAIETAAELMALEGKTGEEEAEEKN